MTKDEALKLALQALEEAADAIDSWGSYASGYFQVKHDLENDISKARNAIITIKEALAQPEPKYLAFMDTPQRTWVGLTDEEVGEWTPEIHAVIRAIEAKLKEKNTWK